MEEGIERGASWKIAFVIEDAFMARLRQEERKREGECVKFVA